MNLRVTCSNMLLLGYFDYMATQTGWDLTFYPVNFKTRVYDVSSVNFSILNNYSGITTIAQLGDVVKINSGVTTISAGSSPNRIFSALPT
mgnify:CR=1 FL=1